MKTVALSQKHMTYHRVIERLIRRSITEKETAELLNKSVRQVRRMKWKVLASGIVGLVHGNTGRHAWNKLDASTVERIVTLYTTKYQGFNCLHFRDMLEEHEGILVKRELLRLIFLSHNLPRKKRKAPRRFTRRERKPQAGMLIQQDTSTHDWFGLGVPCALVASIDDANNDVVYAQFFPSDGTIPNMTAMKTIMETKGIPVSFYVDRASHFKTTRHESVHVQLTGIYDETQIVRALTEAGSTLILDISPQAKGRVERLFETLQDRLVKELALAEIKSIDEGNRFLVSWIPAFNRRFMVEPASKITSYRKLPNHLALARIFSIQEDRIVKADNTISFKGKMYLISVSAQRASFAKTTVTVHQFVDRTLHIFYQGNELSYTPSWTKSLGNEEDIIAWE